MEEPLGSGGGGPRVTRTTYEVTYTDGETVPSPRAEEEEIRDLIEEKTGHRPEGRLQSVHHEGPDMTYTLGSREPEFMNPEALYIDFVEYPDEMEATEADDDTEDALRTAGIELEQVEFEWEGPEDDRTEKAGATVFDPEVEAILNRESPLAVDALMVDEDTHEALQEEMEFSGSFSIGFDDEDEVASWLMQTKEDLTEAFSAKAHPAQATGDPTMSGNSWVGDIPTKECPECGTEFKEGEGIDGDDGTAFCSLKCLNNHVNP